MYGRRVATIAASMQKGDTEFADGTSRAASGPSGLLLDESGERFEFASCVRIGDIDLRYQRI